MLTVWDSGEGELVASEVADQGGVGNDDLIGSELSGDEGYCDVG